MVKTYLINEDQHDALIRSSRHGKNHSHLTEIEQVMCECAEMDLMKVTHGFDTLEKVFVTFYDAEFKIPALCESWRLFISDNLGNKFLTDTFKKFPDFKKEAEHSTEACELYYTV